MMDVSIKGPYHHSPPLFKENGFQISNLFVDLGNSAIPTRILKGYCSTSELQVRFKMMDVSIKGPYHHSPPLFKENGFQISNLFVSNSPGEIRTHTLRILSASPLPVGLPDHYKLLTKLSIFNSVSRTELYFYKSKFTNFFFSCKPPFL